MDKYQELRLKVQNAAKAVVGMTTGEAVFYLEDLHLRYRLLREDGRSTMITADVRMDRVGVEIEKGIVTKASWG